VCHREIDANHRHIGHKVPEGRSMKLAGKVAVVTGGGSGIGRGIALCLAREGANIAVADLHEANAESVAAEVRALGRVAVGLRCDVTQESDILTSLDRIKADLGRIDIVVNNAGIASPPGMPFTRNSEADWDQAFDVNVKSVFLMCKAIAPYFIERQAGRIINIASIAGPIASLTMPPYSVAKGGVIILTRIVAKELAPHGVTVNAICPGMLWTGFWQNLAQHIAESNPAFRGMTARQVFEKRVAEMIPMRCEQTPDDVGWAAVFLASDQARCITGQSLMVDGGVAI
jgi:meso-butanediol dehydrogenase / (S,S)-butanediol dehydrogenase / diacetyl reductase